MAEQEKAKHIACGDVVPGCSFTVQRRHRGRTCQEGVAHAAHDHGVTDITPELAAKVQAAIKSQ